MSLDTAEFFTSAVQRGVRWLLSGERSIAGVNHHSGSHHQRISTSVSGEPDVGWVLTRSGSPTHSLTLSIIAIRIFPVRVVPRQHPREVFQILLQETSQCTEKLGTNSG